MLHKKHSTSLREQTMFSFFSWKLNGTLLLQGLQQLVECLLLQLLNLLKRKLFIYN